MCVCVCVYMPIVNYSKEYRMFRIQNKATKDKPKQQRLRQRQVYNEQNDSLCCAIQSMKD